MRPYSLILLSLTLLSACNEMPGLADHAAGPEHIIYSPTGDPLNGGPLGNPTCEEALKKWFMRVDADHNGAVTLDEFLNEAEVQFQRMDLDKSGYLVSEEVERFRLPYRDFSGNNKKHAQSEDSTASVIDPVMSADSNLDYKVTLDEFTAYSGNRFRELDADHNGVMTLAEATTLCGAKP